MRRKVTPDNPRSMAPVAVGDLRKFAGNTAKERGDGLRAILDVLAQGPRDEATRKGFRNSIRRLTARERSRLDAVVRAIRDSLPPGEPQAAIAELLADAEQARDESKEEP